jgi:hypothetical protein
MDSRLILQGRLWDPPLDVVRYGRNSLGIRCYARGNFWGRPRVVKAEPTLILPCTIHGLPRPRPISDSGRGSRLGGASLGVPSSRIERTPPQKTQAHPMSSIAVLLE